MSGSGAHLVYHVDKGLGVTLIEAADYLTPIPTRKGGLDQGGAVGRNECTFDQAPNGWSATVKKED